MDGLQCVTYPKSEDPPLVLGAGVWRRVQAAHGRIAGAEGQRAVTDQAATRCGDHGVW